MNIKLCYSAIICNHASTSTASTPNRSKRDWMNTTDCPTLAKDLETSNSRAALSRLNAIKFQTNKNAEAVEKLMITWTLWTTYGAISMGQMKEARWQRYGVNRVSNSDSVVERSWNQDKSRHSTCMFVNDFVHKWRMEKARGGERGEMKGERGKKSILEIEPSGVIE